ncbi:helix-turn-helix domain-containing protein [Vallitalea guaymasensis]|uniref:helix-turn-helix domain-containing protein n=1 Tax=Vallitalea guaymasensis TaxID=1185412 RepID=UPI000DE24BBB|nr:helix-turn-helix domain-containing protein [Vallitalea guaymasensis]
MMNVSEILALQENKKKIRKKNFFNNKLLEQIIIKSKYSKKDIADFLNISKGLVSQWTKDKQPSLFLYYELCNLLEIDYGILLKKE